MMLAELEKAKTILSNASHEFRYLLHTTSHLLPYPHMHYYHANFPFFRSCFISGLHLLADALFPSPCAPRTSHYRAAQCCVIAASCQLNSWLLSPWGWQGAGKFFPHHIYPHHLTPFYILAQIRSSRSARVHQGRWMIKQENNGQEAVDSMNWEAIHGHGMLSPLALPSPSPFLHFSISSLPDVFSILHLSYATSFVLAPRFLWLFVNFLIFLSHRKCLSWTGSKPRKRQEGERKKDDSASCGVVIIGLSGSARAVLFLTKVLTWTIMWYVQGQKGEENQWNQEEKGWYQCRLNRTNKRSHWRGWKLQGWGC